MKRLMIALLAMSLTSPALAQHQGHSMPGHKMPAPKAKQKPAPKQPTQKAPALPAAKAKPAAKATGKPAVRKAVPKAAVDPHAGHSMPQAADPHAAHRSVAPAEPQSDPHAGHAMPATDSASPPVGPPPAGALSGPAHAADAVYGADQMAAAREGLRKEHGDITTSKLMIDRLEGKVRNGRDGYAWELQAWHGGDIDKLWLKSEGEGTFGHGIEQAEVQALWSHAIDPWFDLQTGIRYDLGPDPDRAHLVLGIQGLAPYWFEVDAAAFLSTKGDLTARIEAEYDQRITQKLILQPRVEFDLSAQDVPELGIGSGLSTAEVGLRLRYEVVPEFAPYVGVQYERTFGDTAAFHRTASKDVGGWSVLLGARAWF